MSTVKPPEYFRAGAGAVILNAEGLVLALERKKIPGAWQLPQGGLDAGEEPLATAFREIKEETGITPREIALLEKEPILLAYELPEEMRSAKTGRGQANYWFCFRFKGQAIDLADSEEFRAWKWMTFAGLLRSAVPFRIPVYEKLAQHFAGHYAK